MNKKNMIIRLSTTILFFLSIFGAILAQTPTRMGPASPEIIEKALKEVEADMDNIKAHSDYIYAMGMKNPDLLTQYDTWVSQYPENVNIPLAIATVYYKARMPQPRDYLIKASILEPQNAEIWIMLGEDADIRGQTDLLADSIRKASLAEPSNVKYAYYYILSLKNIDPIAYEKGILDFIKRFPDDKHGAMGLYNLARSATGLNDKIAYLEKLRSLYPPQKFERSASGMIELSDYYLQIDPEKALTLIKEMGDEGNWKIRREVAESIIEIAKLEQQQDYTAAITKLNQVKLPYFNYINDFIALKKAYFQTKIGNMKGAYDSLAIKFAILPSDTLFNALELYGSKLGKNAEQAQKDIEMIRSNASIPAYPFELGLYTSNEMLSLDSLKGKVVLLTFWFPSCAPCRQEFPYFQTVVDSFQGEDLVYIGINITPSQDGFVMPYMENTKYSFIPLRSDIAFAKQNYGVIGAPTNFLIDKTGQIIFKNFRIDNSNQRTLELMISSLLAKDR